MHMIFYAAYLTSFLNILHIGHGTEQHVRKPTVVEALRGKKISHVAVGALHWLAVTDNGQVYSCGDNDLGNCFYLFS